MIQRFLDNNIVVPLPDTNIQGITLKRKAFVQTIRIEIEAQRVALSIKVYYYGVAENNDYGDILALPGILPFIVEMVADNTNIVDAATGQVLCPVTEEYYANPAYEEGSELPEKLLNPLLENLTYMYEFEFFSLLMHQPVVVAQMATAKILYAASTGRI